MDAYLERFDRRLEEEVEFDLGGPAPSGLRGPWMSSCIGASLRRLLAVPGSLAVQVRTGLSDRDSA